jgi:hypothetical protein
VEVVGRMVGEFVVGGRSVSSVGREGHDLFLRGCRRLSQIKVAAAVTETTVQSFVCSWLVCVCGLVVVVSGPVSREEGPFCSKLERAYVIGSCEFLMSQRYEFQFVLGVINRYCRYLLLCRAGHGS